MAYADTPNCTFCFTEQVANSPYRTRESSAQAAAAFAPLCQLLEAG